MNPIAIVAHITAVGHRRRNARIAAAVTRSSHPSGSGVLPPALTPLVPNTISTAAANAKATSPERRPMEPTVVVMESLYV
jgi:hypothetical protein